MKRKQNDLLVYAEGGGESDQLRSELRQAFAEFFDKTGLITHKPRVIASGSREDAFRDFCIALNQGKNALLLVDSEAPVKPKFEMDNRFLPWEHLKEQDNWSKPERAKDEDCHLMVQCMESWFLADWKTVAKFFGQGFRENAKPKQPIEKASKQEVIWVLETATCDTKKGKYNKGSHSFKLLSAMSPAALISVNLTPEASPWASRFIKEIARRKSGGS